MNNLTGGMLLLFLSGSAWATVNCSASSSPVAFGTIDPVTNRSPLATSSGSVTLNCTATKTSDTSNYTISLSTGSSGSYTSRTMKYGSNKLYYNLYTDAARTMVFGNGSGSTHTASGTNRYSGSLSSTNTITVYGSIPNNQFTIPAGSYSDTITVNVTY